MMKILLILVSKIDLLTKWVDSTHVHSFNLLSEF